MAKYTFRCRAHGDFTAEQPMADTTRTLPCPAILSDESFCGDSSPKVLGARLQFSQGRQAFHDGIELTGETNRETGDRWRSEFKAEHGRDLEPAGARWV
jgi:hypothetical protein